MNAVSRRNRKYHREYFANHKNAIKAYRKIYRDTHKEEKRKYDQRHYRSPKGSFSQHKNQARIRSIPWGLSFDQFVTFWQKPCFYCGSVIGTVGLDRINSKLGYNIANVLPCCNIDNRAKGILSVIAYLAHCKRLSEYQTMLDK